MRNMSEYGERVVVSGAAVGWCPVIVPGDGAQAPTFGAQRSMSVVRLWCFELDNEKESAARTKTMIN